MPASAAPSQTLSRGLRILELLAEARRPLTIDELTAGLGVHRSIAYRLLRTLEEHGLATRDRSGLVRLGSGLAALAAGVSADLQAEALPELTAAANELGMTCFLTVTDHDECVTLVSVEPRHAVASLAQRPGTRHPVTVGAPGKAVLAALPEARLASLSPELAAEVATARERGYAVSHDEVVPTLRAVAVPLSLRGQDPAAVAAVYLSSDHDPAQIADRLSASAASIRTAIDG